MLKKVLTVIATLGLLLATAQLALAQQDTTQPVQEGPQQQNAGGTQPSGVVQQPTTPADTAGQNPGQNQPSLGPQSPPSSTTTTPKFMSLDKNNQLVIDCPAVSNALANPGLTQPEHLGLQELWQLCANGGFAPTTNTNGGGSNQPGSNGPAPTPQPQQSQSASTPAGDGGTNGASPNGAPSNPPQQSVAVYPS